MKTKVIKFKCSHAFLEALFNASVLAMQVTQTESLPMELKIYKEKNHEIFHD